MWTVNAQISLHYQLTLRMLDKNYSRHLQFFPFFAAEKRDIICIKCQNILFGKNKNIINLIVTLINNNLWSDHVTSLTDLGLYCPDMPCPLSLVDRTLNPLGFSLLWFEPPSGHLWESQVLRTDSQVVFFLSSPVFAHLWWPIGSI